MKKCKECGELKELSEFYKHKNCMDGHINQCKECRLIYARKYHKKNKENIAANKKEYSKTPAGLLMRKRKQQKYILKFPLKIIARNDIAGAIRSGKIIRQPCEICGEKAQAHHPDYTKPLEVDWLCQKHHYNWHEENEAYYPESGNET